jgi:hypothetical protein
MADNLDTPEFPRACSTNVHSALAQIRESQVRTETDVKWIKESLGAGSERLDEHERRIDAQERTVAENHSFNRLINGMIAAVVGALAGTAGEKLFSGLF